MEDDGYGGRLFRWLIELRWLLSFVGGGDGVWKTTVMVSKKLVVAEEEWRLPQWCVWRCNRFMEWRDDVWEVVSLAICDGCVRKERTEGDRRWR